MRLTVVIPAYNEACRLPETLDRVVRYLTDTPRWQPAEIIVVDDGSTDGTSAVVDHVVTSGEVRVVCLAHAANRGKGAAVRTGFAAARGETILLCDADLATPIEEIERLAPASTAGVAVGSRALDRSRTELRQPMYRDLMGRVFNLAVRALAVGGVHDTQCGFKLFAGDLGRSLASAQRLDGFAFDVELLFLADRWRWPMVEVPVRWRHVEASSVRPVRHSAEMFGDLLLIGWWRLFGHPSERGPTAL